MRLLVIEDDERTRAYLRRALTESGHVVDTAADGEDGLTLGLEGVHDVIIVDRRLPRLDGVTIVQQLRQQGVVSPVLMLSGAAKTTDRVQALQAGCDDYLAKPYAFSEVLARIEALVRRATRRQPGPILEVGDLALDTLTREVTRAGKPIQLQRRECSILEVLMRHAGQIVTRLMVMEAVWPADFDPRGNIVDMHIHRLRRKLAVPGSPELIRTIPGDGYLLVPSPAQRS